MWVNELTSRAIKLVIKWEYLQNQPAKNKIKRFVSVNMLEFGRKIAFFYCVACDQKQNEY